MVISAHNVKVQELNNKTMDTEIMNLIDEYMAKYSKKVKIDIRIWVEKEEILESYTISDNITFMTGRGGFKNYMNSCPSGNLEFTLNDKPITKEELFKIIGFAPNYEAFDKAMKELLKSRTIVKQKKK